MIFSALVAILRDEIHEKNLADKEVEFCTESRANLELLSVYEDNKNGEDRVCIGIGTSEDSEERDDEIVKTQTAEKIVLDWGRAGQGQPPNARQIEDTLKLIKEKARGSNAFSLYGVPDRMVEYLKDRLDPDNAIIKVVNADCIIIGIDEKTVQIMYDDI